MPRAHDNAHDNAYDNARLAAAYEAGNEMPETSLRAWTDLIASFAPGPAPAMVEIGAGTGMFCAAMARWHGASPVLGVDPSPAMLAQARLLNHHEPAVHYVNGTAEAVPTGSALFDLALLSRVIHHLPDRRACARELVRVLRPGGVAVIRTTFRENLDSVVYDYWPRLRETDTRRFPSRDDVLTDFTLPGLSLLQVASFAQPLTESLTAYHARMATRPQSKFAHLSPTEFTACLTRLHTAATTQHPAQPVLERYDVVVLTRTDASASPTSTTAWSRTRAATPAHEDFS